jgi:hypothetical protein
MKLKPFSGYKYLRSANKVEKARIEELVLNNGTVDVQLYRGMVLDGLVGLSLCRKHGLEPCFVDRTHYIKERWPKAQPYFYSMHCRGKSYARHVYLAGNLMADYVKDTGISSSDCAETFRLLGGESKNFYVNSYRLCRYHSEFAEPLKKLEIDTTAGIAGALLDVANAAKGKAIDDMENFLLEQVSGLKSGSERASQRKQLSASIKSGEQAVGRCVRILGGLRGATKSMNQDEMRRWKQLHDQLEMVIREAQDLRNSLDTFL